jgi:signal transduction histidine kinase
VHSRTNEARPSAWQRLLRPIDWFIPSRLREDPTIFLRTRALIVGSFALGLVELQAANAAKDNFLARMSHELRTPLNAVIGYSEMIADDAEDKTIAEDGAKIEQAAKHLLGIIEEILEFSNLHDHAPLQTEAVELHALLQEIVASIQPLTAKSRNSISFEVDPQVTRVTIDPFRVRQVLLSLLSNACKFTSEGTINIIARPCEARAQLCIEVRDTGIGIAAEMLELIFEPFAQGDTSLSRRFDGTGLGLTVARQICERMGGQLTVKSTPGEGSSFTIQLPRDGDAER